MNPFDEIAVEEALRQKEAGKATEVVVVSIGPAQAARPSAPRSPWAPTAASSSRPTALVEPLAVAKLLKGVVDAEQPGLVIMGKQAIDDDSNQTGQMLAALLGWGRARSPPRSSIGDGSVEVTREVDGGMQTVALKLPAIVTTDLRLNEPRYASLPNIMKAKKKPIDEKTPGRLRRRRRAAAQGAEDRRARRAARPASRSSSVAELVAKLQDEAGVI